MAKKSTKNPTHPVYHRCHHFWKYRVAQSGTNIKLFSELKNPKEMLLFTFIKNRSQIIPAIGFIMDIQSIHFPMQSNCNKKLRH
jgi:hypothetical protein